MRKLSFDTMVSLITIALMLGILSLTIGLSLTQRTPPDKPPIPNQKDTIPEEVPKHPSDSVLQLQIEAIAWIESHHIDSAVNKKSGARGYLQITPIFVAEANRLQDTTVYTFDDAFSRTKSIEMFNIVNNHHNPDRLLEESIRLHNSRAASSYKEAIINHYNLLASQ